MKFLYFWLDISENTKKGSNFTFYFFFENLDKNFENPKMSLGIPIKVLHEAEGHVMTCESSTGEVYRGKLVEAEEHMNIQVKIAKNKNKKI